MTRIARNASPLSPRPDFFSEALRRARTADLAVSRPARRTLAEMAPGYERQPVLRLVPEAVQPEIDAVRVEVRRLTTYVGSGAFRSAPRESQDAALDNLAAAEARLESLLAAEREVEERCARLTAVAESTGQAVLVAVGHVLGAFTAPVAPVAANDEPCIFCEKRSCNGNCGGFTPAPASARAALKQVA